MVLKYFYLPSYPKSSEIKTTQYADDIMVDTKAEAALHEALEDVIFLKKSAGLKLILEIIAFRSYSDKTKICAIYTVDNIN